MENALDLTQHTPGTLPHHAAYLHQRTAGRIGSLSRLIRQAAKPPSPPSPPSATAPNASPRKHSKPSPSTTSPKKQAAPEPANPPERHDADMKTTTETPGGDEFAALCRQAWDTLTPAHAGYLADVSPHYDEVLHDVAQRTEHTGSLGKTDIAALVVWKRLSAQTRG